MMMKIKTLLKLKKYYDILKMNNNLIFKLNKI